MKNDIVIQPEDAASRGKQCRTERKLQPHHHDRAHKVYSGETQHNPACNSAQVLI